MNVLTSQSQFPITADSTSTFVRLNDGSAILFFTNGSEPQPVNPYDIEVDPSGDVYGQRFLTDGTMFGAPFRVNSTTFHGQYYPVVLQFESGEFVVAWSQTQTGSSFAIGYQRFDAQGQPVGTEVLITTVDDPVNTLVVTSTGGNGFLLYSGRTGEIFQVMDTNLPVLKIEGDQFDNTLTGDTANESISGGAGNDILDGSGGNDILVGGSGSNTLYGGDGNDTFVFQYLSTDTIVDTFGQNTLRVERAPDGRLLTIYYDDQGSLILEGTNGSSVKVENPTSLSDIRWVPLTLQPGNTGYSMAMQDLSIGTLGNDTLTTSTSSYVEAYGADGDDQITVSAQSSFITGDGGSDLIYGGSGSDQLHGDYRATSTGNDTLYGGDGDDSLYGGGGDDLLSAGGGQNFVDGGNGNDVIVFQYEGNTTVSDAAGHNWLRVERPADTLYFSKLYYNTQGGLVLEGLNGSSITVSDTANLLGIQWSAFTPEDGYSTYSMPIQDLVIGTLGSDVLSTSSSAYVEAYGADGDDQITILAGSSWVTGDGGSDVVFGGLGNDAIHGDYTYPDTGNDTLYGRGGNDVLWGEAGQDMLFGGDGDDLLKGDAGNDSLDGGTGNDTIDGGGGLNTATYSGNRSDYTITQNVIDGTTTVTDIRGIDGTDILTAINRLQFADQITVELDGTPINNAPIVFHPIELTSTVEDVVRTITLAELLAGSNDADGDTLTVTDLAASSGSLAYNNDGTWNWTPALNDTVGVTFTYNVTDGSASAAQTATLDITPVNDAPTVPSNNYMAEPNRVVNGSFDQDSLNWIKSIGQVGGMYTFSPQWWVNFYETNLMGQDVVPGWESVLDQNGDVGNFDIVYWDGFNDPASSLYLYGTEGYFVDLGGITYGQSLGAPLRPHALLTQIVLSATKGDSILSFDFSAWDINHLGTADFAVFLNGEIIAHFAFSNSAGQWVSQLFIDGSISIEDKFVEDGSIGWKTAAILVPDTYGEIFSIGFQGGGWSSGRFDPLLQADDWGAALDNVALRTNPTGYSFGQLQLASALEDTPRLITTAQLLSGARDADGDILSVVDLVASSGSLFDNANGTWTWTPVANDTTGVTFSYNVTDGSASVAQTATLDLTPVNDAPVITSDGGGVTATVAVSENTTAAITVAATDADPGSVLTYRISGGADAALFAMDATSGVLTFVSALDFEMPTDAGANNVYDVVVEVSDGTLTDTQALVVTVTNVNDNSPVITSNGGGVSASVSMAENATAVSTVVAADADAGALLSYRISGGADAALFAVDASSGVLAFISAPNFDGPTDAGANNVYDVVVEASDGILTDTQALAVTVTNVNDAPIVAASVNLGSTPEDTARTITASALLAGATDADGDVLSVANLQASSGSLVNNNNGTWTWTPALNDTTGVTFTYNITDGTASVAQTATLDLTPINDAPTGVVVIQGNALQGQTLTANTTAIADADGLGGFSYIWYRDGAVINGATAATYLLTAGDVGAAITARVSYTDGFNTAETFLSAATALVAPLSVPGVTRTGTARADTLNGTGGDDVLSGLGGNDRITGLGGNDRLLGGDGNDTLSGGLGDDTLDGGAGTDTATYADMATGVTVSLAITTTQETGAGSVLLIGIENLIGGNGNDTLSGNAGANNINGGGGDDLIMGGAGNDTLTGGANGAAGDTVSYADATAGVTVSLAVTRAQNTGTSTGSDVLSGFENLEGSAFSDQLTGSTGNNIIHGGAGSDRITGGDGTDYLYGGEGADTFVFVATSNSRVGIARDVIFDWELGDVLDFSAIDANTVTRGNQAFTFIGASTFTAAGQLRMYEANGVLLVEGNTGGTIDPEFQLELKQWNAATFSDILL